MIGGDFGAAAAKFAALVESAPDPASRILAAGNDVGVPDLGSGRIRTRQRRRGLALSAPAVLEDRRTTDEIAILYTNAVLYGLYAGIVLDVWTNANSAGSAILPPLALAGASAGIVAVLDHNVRLGYGVAQSIVSGMYVGFEEGIAWTLWHEASVQGSSKFGAKTVTTMIWGLGTLGAVAGGVVGSAYGTTPGRASLMGSAAMWSGLVAGTLAGGITEHADSALLSSAVALNAGAVLGAIAGAEVSPSIARVRFIDLGGLSGGLLLGGLYWAVKDREATGAGAVDSDQLGYDSRAHGGVAADSGHGNRSAEKTPRAKSCRTIGADAGSGEHRHGLGAGRGIDNLAPRLQLVHTGRVVRQGLSSGSRFHSCCGRFRNGRKAAVAGAQAAHRGRAPCARACTS